MIESGEISNGAAHGSSKLNDFSTDKRIIYTREFLMEIRDRENSQIPPQFEYNIEPFCDPENSFLDFNSVMLNKKRKSVIDPINKSELYKYKNRLEPYTKTKVSLCTFSKNTKNDFWVNIFSSKETMKSMYADIHDYCKKLKTHVLEKNQEKQTIFLGLSQGSWYRVRLIEKSQPMTAFCIDNAKEFVPESLISCPDKFKDIPNFAFNVVLFGVDSKYDFDKRQSEAFLDFKKNSEYFTMKIDLPIDNVKEKSFVEFYNEKQVCLNAVLNPRLLVGYNE